MTHASDAPAKEIEALLARLCACWDRVDLGAIRALWDEREPEPYLLPQEVAHPIIGWDAFDAHWQAAAARLKRASMRVWDVHVKSIAPDVAVALYQFHWNGDIDGFTHLVGISSRATAIFRRTPKGWKFIHYVEAQTAPLMHLQRYYDQNVDPGFKEGQAN